MVGVASQVEDQASSGAETTRAQIDRLTEDVSVNITGVRDAVQVTGVRAGELLQAAEQLSVEGEGLRVGVQEFMGRLQAA